MMIIELNGKTLLQILVTMSSVKSLVKHVLRGRVNAERPKVVLEIYMALFVTP